MHVTFLASDLLLGREPGEPGYDIAANYVASQFAQLGLTPADVISSIKEQNIQAPTGKVGAAPTPKDQQFTNTVNAPGRLVTPQEFENIIVRQSETGAVVRIRPDAGTSPSRTDVQSPLGGATLCRRSPILGW